jgi:ribonuclease HI
MEDSEDDSDSEDEIESHTKPISRNVNRPAAPACEAEDSDDGSETSDSEEESDTEESKGDRAPATFRGDEAGKEYGDVEESGNDEDSTEDTDMDESEDEEAEEEESQADVGHDTDMSESQEDDVDEGFLAADITNRMFDTSQYDDYARNPRIYQQSSIGSWYELSSTKRRTCCRYRRGIPGSVVIPIDGSCRNNGKKGALAASAVFFHPRNVRFNSSSLLLGKAQTSRRAELDAALKALRTVSQIRNNNPPLARSETRRHRIVGVGPQLRRVVIRTDYIPLVEGMVRDIYYWKQNGFKTKKQNKSVLDMTYFREIIKRSFP